MKPIPGQRSNATVVPLFPLPETVLLPGSLLPLHIFEPRYRRMTADVLADDRPLAIGLRRSDEGGASGLAGVAPIVGVGKISDHEQLPDGRFHLLVRGIGRARVVEEVETDAPYKAVRTIQVHEYVEDVVGAGRSVETLRSCALALARRRPGRGRSLMALIERHFSEPSILTDALADTLYSESDDRQRMLEQSCVDRRLEQLIDTFCSLLVEATREKDEGDESAE